ncbi:MAG TPA: DUF397 domain-containing protein, partial [Streptosporangiaceae bacterium]
MSGTFSTRLTLVWQRACSSAGNGACVEVAIVRDKVTVRNSRDPSGDVLTFAMPEWRAFLDGVKKGDFDPPAPEPEPKGHSGGRRGRHGGSGGGGESRWFPAAGAEDRAGIPRATAPRRGVSGALSLARALRRRLGRLTGPTARLRRYWLVLPAALLVLLADVAWFAPSVNAAALQSGLPPVTL